MSRSDCKNVRHQIEELAEHHNLSATARSHIQVCNECASFENDERKLRHMVASLSGVEAPADFDFKLRARIAAATPARRSFSLNSVFGIRSIAFATLVLLFGVVLVLVNNRSRTNSVSVSSPATEQANEVAHSNSQADVNALPSNSTGAMVTTSSNEPAKSSEVSARRNKGNAAPQFVARRGSVKTTDLSAAPARLLRPETATGSAVFPLDASYQSLKVSIDDGRGSSKTISLPTVSFGSSRALAQNPRPTMASMRDSW